MAKPPDRPHAPGKPKEKPKGRLARDPAKHSKKDPARPTRAKAARPDLPPIEPALAELLNPGIGRAPRASGSQTGLKPPPDNSLRPPRRFLRRPHGARKSTQGFGEAPQARLSSRRPTRGPSIPNSRRRWDRSGR